MRLRHYLKGLGIGMAVTALILHFSVHAAEPSMTDEEVIARARELGMIENVVLSRNDPTINGGNSVSEGNMAGGEDTVSGNGNAVADGEDTVSGNGNVAADGEDDVSGNGNAAGGQDSDVASDGQGDHSGTAENGNASSGDPAGEDILSAAGNDDEAETESQEGMSGAEAGQDSVTITVTNGDSSVSVAGKLAALGLVSSQAEYDEYLCSHGYDRTIRTGVHVIPVGATEQQIAEIITSKQ